MAAFQKSHSTTTCILEVVTRMLADRSAYVVRGAGCDYTRTCARVRANVALDPVPSG